MVQHMVCLEWMILIVFPVIIAKAPVLIMSHTADLAMDVAEDSNQAKTDLKFKVDTAKLTISKQGLKKDSSLGIWSLSDNCHGCIYYQVDKITPNKENITFLVDTRWPTSIKLIADVENCSATIHHFFGERGEYSINFTAVASKNLAYNCSISFSKDRDPWNSNLPILVAFLILLITGLLYTIGCWLYERKRSTSHEALDGEDDANPSVSANDSHTSPPAEVAVRPRERLTSIDTFRGLCIVIMIFVNFKGGYYWFFRHSAWNGLTVADLVFPWFMFIMGVNIPLSVNSLLRRNTPRIDITYKLVRRTLILFALGITVINQNKEWSTLRIPGVLQRFAIAYFVAFLLQWCFHVTPDALESKALKDGNTRKWWYPVSDILLYWPQWLVAIGLEALWLALTFYLPVPGCPTGYLGPGGLALNNSTYPGPHCIGGAAGYIDRWIFGENHMYGHPTAKNIYYPLEEGKVPYDPEGVLGSIHGCIIVFIGCQMGKIFLYYKEPMSRTIRWLLWGLVLGAVSAGLCSVSTNDGWIPVNKNLWTTTFITTLSSMAFFLMVPIYYLVDVYKVWTGAPLNFVGMNSILLYVGHETYHGILPFHWGATEFSTHAEWLAMNMLGAFYWVVIAYYCYKIKFFLKI